MSQMATANVVPATVADVQRIIDKRKADLARIKALEDEAKSLRDAQADSKRLATKVAKEELVRLCEALGLNVEELCEDVLRKTVGRDAPASNDIKGDDEGAGTPPKKKRAQKIPGRPEVWGYVSKTNPSQGYPGPKPPEWAWVSKEVQKMDPNKVRKTTDIERAAMQQAREAWDAAHPDLVAHLKAGDE
jgi:hypothetical protein